MLVTPFVTLSYINSAQQEIGLNFYSSFVCEGCDETANNQIHSIKQGGTHGRFFTGMSLDERNIRLTGHIRHGITLENAMRSLQNVFNPTVTGNLVYENQPLGIKREIACRVTELPQVFWSNRQLRFDIPLIALDPFWRGQSVIQNIAETLKKFCFPAVIPPEGMSFGLRKQTLESEFENMGNVESGFLVVFRAQFGSVLNPEIRNMESGERIRILYNMEKGDVITILNDLQERRVEINGINGFRHLDAANTSFFRLAVGTNRVGFWADSNINNLSLHIRYTPNFTFAEG
ncbi:MAG: phage tail family protein [Defluviitaleaceae bacterium]|nr:phage tail family protein [Defluviitaleaceae bacterium]